MVKTEVLHYPRLDTVLMVEEKIKELDYYPTKMELWNELPKKMMYQTFKLIIRYLEDSGKILIKDGQIVWTWNPELVKKVLSKPGLKIR